jgi:hypothetical protein
MSFGVWPNWTPDAATEDGRAPKTETLLAQLYVKEPTFAKATVRQALAHVRGF